MEIPARIVTLLDEKSYIRYKPVNWNYQDNGSKLILPIRFRTRSIAGRLITLSAESSQNSTIFAVSAYIDNAAVALDLMDGEGRLVTKTKKQLLGANNGAEHSMSIQVDIQSRMLKMVYSGGTVDLYDFPSSINVEDNMQIILNTGKSGNHFNLFNLGGQNSIIGCVSIIGLTIGDRFVFELEESERSDTIKDGCDPLCSANQCNMGTCVDLFQMAVCDCRGTYKSGRNCTEDIKTLHVSWDQYISYKISDNRSQPSIISIDFKTEVSEGLILHGTVQSLENNISLGKLKLALIYGQLRLTIANLAEINFDNIEINKDRLGDELFFCGGDVEVGLSGCLREIYVDYFDVIQGYSENSDEVGSSQALDQCDESDSFSVTSFDLAVGQELMSDEKNFEQISTEAPARRLCENFEATSCENFVECVKENDVPICVCRKGFTGQYCQFSLLPRHCDEVYRQGNTMPGTYVIDPDSSGLLPETYAYCENGKTIISHNMPNDTLIRSSSLGDIHMIINYKFNVMKTWFSSLSHESYFGFGSQNGTCLCKDGKCAKCNCDKGGIAIDYGVLTGFQVPVQNVYALNDPSDNKGYLTLGPLVCSGNVGYSAQHTLVIRDQFSPVEIGSWRGDRISFEFRTFLENACLLSSDNGKIVITMTERTFHLFFDNGFSLDLFPQSRKNDGHWHRVVVNILGGSILFSVDDTVVTTTFAQNSFGIIRLRIGGLEMVFSFSIHFLIVSDRDGFLGCVRQILLNDILQEVNQKLQGNCFNRCESHNCQHESQCEEDFTSDTIRCVCKNSIIYSGDLCQFNANFGTELSFRHANQAFLKAQNLAVEDALMQRIIFSFRTDQRDALLFYLHDQFYNFIQVHLLDYSRVILTLNFNQTIRRCEVMAKVGYEFSRMKWIQVMIFQMSHVIEFNVDEVICQIIGQRTLSNEFIRKFELARDVDDLVQPPVSPVTEQETEYSHPYVLLFIAGIPNENHLGTMDPIYQSSIPNLLGCMRGLMLGEVLIDMRNKSYWSYYPSDSDMIKFDCKMGCGTIEHMCKNGGHCAVKWTSKNASDQVMCNCDRTSYFGEYCDQALLISMLDYGAHFEGSSILVMNTAEIFEKVIFDWNQFGEQKFSFAFSAKSSDKSDKQSKPQTIAAIIFKHQINGSIDSVNFDFPSDLTEFSFAHISKFFFGGTNVINANDYDKLSARYNYTGCISNIEIDTSIARMHFSPILYLRKPEMEFAQSTKVIGDELQLGVCSSFLIPGTFPSIISTVTPPLWDSPFVSEPYERPIPEWKVVHEEIVKERVDDSAGDISDCMLYCSYYHSNLSTAEKKPKIDACQKFFGKSTSQETKSLLSDKEKERRVIIKNDFVLPEPDQCFDSGLVSSDDLNVHTQ
ncbi:unnamed protein product [Thelazia callipaeda]|uniref:EGF-like domain-containing protein n=1 Tax=Thelazia callipaeda TaxID=103827 RepID=A0A0N5CL33_THECL|nr:unnamed protein product [Thelazia callipaeda]